MTAATRGAIRIATLSGQMKDNQGGAEDEASERDHGADGKIELAANHQQRRANRQDAKLRAAASHEVYHACEREHGGVGGEKKKIVTRTSPADGAEFRATCERGHGRDLLQALVGSGSGPFCSLARVMVVPQR